MHIRAIVLFFLLDIGVELKFRWWVVANIYHYDIIIYKFKLLSIHFWSLPKKKNFLQKRFDSCFFLVDNKDIIDKFHKMGFIIK